MSDDASNMHAELQATWHRVLAAMVEEAVDPAAVAATMLEVAIAARLAFVGPRQLADDLANGSMRTAALADQMDAVGDRPVIHSKAH